MLKRVQNKKAQAVASEYALTFFLVIGVMSAMTTYFKRATQARIYDARNAMVNMVLTRVSSTDVIGNLLVEYEPYYANTVSTISRDVDNQTRLFGGGSSGVFSKTLNERTLVSTFSETAPPKDAK